MVDIFFAIIETLRASLALQVLVAIAAIFLIASKLRGHNVPDIKVDPPTGEQSNLLSKH